MIRWTAAVLASTLVLASPAPAAPEEEVGVGEDVGQLFPDYAFPTLRSTDITRLSSFRGTKVLLVQFASW